MTTERNSSWVHPDDPRAGGQPRLMLRIWRRRWTFILVSLACMGGGIAYLRLATRLYTATSRLYVEQHEPRLPGEATPDASQQSDNFVYAQVEALTSTPVLSQALQSLPVGRMQAFAHAREPLLFLKKKLDVEVGKKDAGIAVSFDAPSTQEATAVVKAVIEAYLDRQSRQQQLKANEMLRVLQEEKRRRDADLAAKSAELVAFRQANPSLSLDGGTGKGNIVLERLGQLSDDLTTAQLQTAEDKAKYDATRATAQTKDGEHFLCTTILASDKEYQDLVAELHRLERTAASLKGRGYGENSPAAGVIVALAQAQEQVDTKEKQAIAAHLKGLEQKWRESQDKEQSIQRAYDQQRRLATELDAKRAEYARLQSEQARLEKLCEVPERQITEMRLARGSSALNARILEPPAAKDIPTHPDPLKVLGLAGALGLLLGSGLALLRDAMNAPLRSADEIMTTLGMPVLGVVPRLKAKPAARGRSILLEPSSEAAEAYRAISMSMSFFLPPDKAKTILVTSPEPGDGKSTSASNVAIALAQAGYRTLLLDADCRRPMQHKVFGLGPHAGLSEVSAGSCSLGEAIHTTSIPRLDVLPCGAVPVSASEILNGRSFADLIRMLSREYEKIVIDSPPLLPVVDARLLAGLADATMLVLRADKSTRRASTCGRDGLLSVGAKVVGVVVNDVPARRRRRYDYYYSYGSAYTGQNGGSRSQSGAQSNVPQLVAPQAAHSTHPAAPRP